MRLLAIKDRIEKANMLLEPYAIPHGGMLGRVHTEGDDQTRFPFQRDRDRIIHTQAFRRLKGKTQVFVADHGDHYRTRITHTLEVAQISRDIARTLGVNEDLAESIALAHDLGHTPFGHAGEEAMDACMKRFGKTFEHNEQSLRIVTLLEERSSVCAGLNLHLEILEGLMKHRTPHDAPACSIARAPSIEAQIVNLADEIAYTAHDSDDGLRAKLFSYDDIAKTRLGKKAWSIADEKGTEMRGALVHLLVMDLYQETERRLAASDIRNLDAVYQARTPLVAFGTKMTKDLRSLRQFLWDRLYKSSAVLEQAQRGQRIIARLFDQLMQRPSEKVLSLQKTTGSDLVDAVKDYIAGMTDAFAEESIGSLKKGGSHDFV